MLATFKKNIKDGTLFTGIEYTVLADATTLYCSQLSRKKNELELVNTFKENSAHELSLKLKKNASVFLVINTDQTLSKIITTRLEDDLATVNTAFPNIDVAAFYYEIAAIGNATMVSICRKSYVTSVLKSFSDEKVQLIGFSLAFQQLYQVENFITATVISVSNASLNTTENTITLNTSKDNHTTYKVNGIAIKSNFLLSFSAALSHFLNGAALASNFQDSIAQFKNEFYQHRFFQLFSKSFAMILLGVLLVNFFVFNHYFQKVEQLKQTTQINSSNKEKLLQLNESVSKKEKLVEDIISTSSSKSALYLDQIAALVPGTLLLSAMNYQPVKKKIKANEAIVFDINLLEVEGQSKDSEAFSVWLETIEKLSWVSKLEVEDYGFENSSTSFFKIAIQIADE